MMKKTNSNDKIMICVRFIQGEDAKNVMLNSDTYYRKMNSFERSIRMDIPYDNNDPVTYEQFCDYATKHVLDWSDTQKREVLRIVTNISEFFQKTGFKGVYPNPVNFVLTDGLEDIRECAGYCRRNTVVVNQREISSLRVSFVIHELFHIFSQNNPELRDKLYNTLGFFRCNEIVLPDELSQTTITNPDAPNHDVYIHVRVVDPDTNTTEVVRCTPVLFYDRKSKGSFFAKLYIMFLKLFQDSEGTYRPSLTNGRCVLYGVNDVSNFFEQIGNSKYYFHPDEILATRFAEVVGYGVSGSWEPCDDPFERSIQDLLFDNLTIIHNQN